MITIDVAIDRAIADFSFHLDNRRDTIKRRIDTKLYSLDEMLEAVSQDFYYYIGILKAFDIFFPDELIKRDVLNMRLELLYNHFEDDINRYYYHVKSSSSNEVKK